MSYDEFLDVLQRMVKRAGSQKAFAIELHISESYLSDVLTRNRQPGIAILQPLGYREVISYEKVQP